MSYKLTDDDSLDPSVWHRAQVRTNWHDNAAQWCLLLDGEPVEVDGRVYWGPRDKDRAALVRVLRRRGLKVRRDGWVEVTRGR